MTKQLAPLLLALSMSTPAFAAAAASTDFAITAGTSIGKLKIDEPREAVVGAMGQPADHYTFTTKSGAADVDVWGTKNHVRVTYLAQKVAQITVTSSGFKKDGWLSTKSSTYDFVFGIAGTDGNGNMNQLNISDLDVSDGTATKKATLYEDTSDGLAFVAEKGADGWSANGISLSVFAAGKRYLVNRDEKQGNITVQPQAVIVPATCQGESALSPKAQLDAKNKRKSLSEDGVSATLWAATGKQPSACSAQAGAADTATVTLTFVDGSTVVASTTPKAATALTPTSVMTYALAHPVNAAGIAAVSNCLVGGQQCIASTTWDAADKKPGQFNLGLNDCEAMACRGACDQYLVQATKGANDGVSTFLFQSN